MTVATLLTAAVILVLSHGATTAVDQKQFSYAIEKPLQMIQNFLEDPVSLEELTEALTMTKRSTGQLLDHDIVKRSLFKMPKIFTALQNTSKDCRAAFESIGPAIVDTLRGNVPFWILSMFDATGKFVSGTMRGSRLRTGSYSECVRINVRERPGTAPHFMGSLCTVISEYPKSQKQYRVWELQGNNIYPAVPRLETFEIQVCVPSVCSEEDTAKIFTQVSRIMEQDLVVTSVSCYYYKDTVLSSWTIFVIVVACFATLLFAVGTTYDTLIRFQAKAGTAYFGTEEHEQNVANIKKLMGPVGHSLLAFSIPNNLHNVLTAEVDDNHIKAIAGIRFLNFLWVVMANFYFISKDMEWKNYAGFLEDLRSAYGQVIINARFAADSMFCISGLLVSLLTLRLLHKRKGKLNFLYFVCHRIIRITPIYMLILMTATAVYYHCGEGVQWMKTDEFQEECGKHWWKGLLFINNFFPESQSCRPLSWYLAVDLQLYLSAPLFLIPLYAFPKLGLGLLGIATVIAMAVPAVITEMYNLPYFIGRKFYFHPNHEDYLNTLLYKQWAHQGPYLIGILYGYLLYAKGTKITMKPAIVTVGWTISIAIQLVLLFGFYDYIDGTAEMPRPLGIVYTSTASTLWAIACGWMIYACTTGYGGFLHNFLSADFFVSCSKTMAVSFLIQDIVLHSFMDSRPDVYYYDLWIVIIITWGTIFAIVLCAIATTAIGYEPVRQLENIWLRKKFVHRSAPLVHFAIAPTSSEDEMDDSVKKLITDKSDDDDDDMESISVYTKNAKALANIDLNKEFKVYQNGAEIKNTEENAPLVANEKLTN